MEEKYGGEFKVEFIQVGQMIALEALQQYVASPVIAYYRVTAVTQTQQIHLLTQTM